MCQTILYLLEGQVVTQPTKQFSFIKRQAVFTVLLFVFIAQQFAWAGVAEDIAAGKSPEDVIQANLDTDIQLKDLLADLDSSRGFRFRYPLCPVSGRAGSCRGDHRGPGWGLEF